MDVFKKKLLKYSELVQIVIVAIYSILFSIYGNALFEEMQNKNCSLYQAIILEGFSRYFFSGLLGIFLLIIQIVLLMQPKTHYSVQIKKSIDPLLESMTKFLFSSLNSKWNYCAMIQICSYKNNTRHTEFSYNAEANQAIYKKLELDFGDVGDAFISSQDNVNTYLVKPLSHNNWLNADDEYKNNVPENLRLIYAVPIYDMSNNGKVIGILEFNVFSEKNDDDSNIPNKVLTKLNSHTIRNALAAWSNGLSYLINV